MKIKVVDDICGSGKTSWAIQRINSPKFGEKFIYVTPYLNEVDRIINSTNAKFMEPEVTRGRGSKMKHFKELLKSNSSIVTTHQLFKKFDSETLELIKNAGYTLIMDEVANVLETLRISKEDLNYLLKAGAIEVRDDGSVKWNDENYGKEEHSRFRDIQNLAKSENLFIYSNVAMFWTMNVNNFLSFKDVYVLTYLFDGQIQRYYYDLHEVEYEKFSVNNTENGYEIISYNKQKEPRKAVYDLLNIYEGKLNENYFDLKPSEYRKKRGLLSSEWFKNATNEQMKQIKNNLRNYFAHITKTETKKLFWTTKKEFAVDLKNNKCSFNAKDDRSRDNYVSLNMRATNNYAECVSMAYVYNRFINPMEKRFFLSKGVEINEDVLAMSDLIQFVFRGCIRKNEPMNCYIPSERMRKLLKDWSEFRD